MSITQRNGKFVTQVYDRGLGRMRQVGTYPTLRAAKKAEAEAKTATHVSKHESVEAFAGRWLELFPRPKQSTNVHNLERVQAFVKVMGRRNLDSITAQEAREWALKNRGTLPALRAMWNDARRLGLVDRNPFEKLGLPGPGKRALDSDWLTAQDVDRLADTALRVHGEYGPTFRAMILFAAYTGVRPGELFALQPEDLAADTVHVRRSASSRTRAVTTPKNGEARVIAYPAIARRAVAEMPVMAEQNTVFSAPRGGRLWAPHFSWLWSPVRAAFGRPRMSFYELRHFTATYLLEHGLTPWQVAVQLGHKDGGALVMKVYGHPSEAQARSAVLALDTPDELKARRAGA